MKSLQIGDWVKYGSKYIKVESITKKKIGYHKEAGESRMHYVRLCGVESIHLTKEILEKNGFVFNLRWHNAVLEIDNFQISIQLGYANKIEYIKIIELGKDNVVPSEKTRLYLPMVKYVHKFQQAMRICSITKSIEFSFRST